GGGALPGVRGRDEARVAGPGVWGVRGSRRRARVRGGAAGDGDRRAVGGVMGRLHRHADGTVHAHDHEHDVGDHTGYTDTGTERVAVLERLLGETDTVAEDNRSAFAAAGVRVVNLMSSPGAGKTTLLKGSLHRLADRCRIGVLEGDIATSL